MYTFDWSAIDSDFRRLSGDDRRRIENLVLAICHAPRAGRQIAGGVHERHEGRPRGWIVVYTVDGDVCRGVGILRKSD